MNALSKITSGTALLLLFILPFLHFADLISLEATKTSLLVVTVLWFASAPLWMGRTQSGE